MGGSTKRFVFKLIRARKLSIVQINSHESLKYYFGFNGEHHQVY